MREILPSIHEIETVRSGRRLRQFLLIGEDRRLLVDAGERETPREALFPYLERIGLPMSTIDIVVATHADTDHHGGLAMIRRDIPSASFACGAYDRSLIELPARLLADRYRAYERDHGVGYPPHALDNASRLEPVTVDIEWSGGEVLSIANGWELEVVPTPGHTDGHIALFDRRHGALFCGDAVQGAGYPDIAGRPLMPPNYIDVAAYEDTIERVRALSPESLYGAHWPTMRGEEVGSFLDASEAFVHRLEEIVADALSHGVTALRELIARVQDALPMWRRCQPMDLAYAVEAHRRRLQRAGVTGA